MFRLLTYIIAIALAATGLAWLADRPGNLQLNWQGYVVETSVFWAAVLFIVLLFLAVMLWSIARILWNGPAIIGTKMVERRKKAGLDALSSGMIAVAAGDRELATRYAIAARKSLPNEAMTHLLRAQAAQLSGDRATARRIYEAMLASPETEQLGLRGLYLEARREGEDEAALQFAERAAKANPKLEWCSEALFKLQCRERKWNEALESLAALKRAGEISKEDANRKRAILLTAIAREKEESNHEDALTKATEAHGLAPELVPAAVIAGRIHASRGNTAKAAKVIERTWAKSPHPDLATIYAHARVGDSTNDRLTRIKKLAARNPHSIESAIAVASAAIDAHDYDTARAALAPLIDNRATQRIARLMAQIEAGDGENKGKIREWLARAGTAAPDPVWTADGIISDHWEPVSPIDGRLDAFHWRVPLDTRNTDLIEAEARRLEELLAISGPAVLQGDVPDAETSEQIPAEDHPVVDRTGAEDAEAVTVKPQPPKEAGQTVPGPDRPTYPERSAAQQAEYERRYVTPDDPGPDGDDDISFDPATGKTYKPAR